MLFYEVISNFLHYTVFFSNAANVDN